MKTAILLLGASCDVFQPTDRIAFTFLALANWAHGHRVTLYRRMLGPKRERNYEWNASGLEPSTQPEVPEPNFGALACHPISIQPNLISPFLHGGSAFMNFQP